MDIGFVLSDGITRVRPDNNLTKRVAPRVLLARFGDGYEQRMPDGINSLQESFQAVFNNRPPEETDAIVNFFEDRLAVEAFEFIIPDSRSRLGLKSIQVVCESWDYIYTHHIATGCIATFRRVYE